MTLLKKMKNVKFEPGIILATTASRDLVFESKTAGQPYMMRHIRGDFGEATYDTQNTNKNNIKNKTGKVSSAYILPNGKTLCIESNLDKHYTIFCLPEEDYTETLIKASAEYNYCFVDFVDESVGTAKHIVFNEEYTSFK